MMTVFLKSTVAPLGVGDAAVVEDLEQDVEDVVVRLLDLVEEEDGVGLAPHRLGELPALFVADVAGRGADQPRHVVPLHVLAHVDADEVVLAVEERRGQGLGELGLADAGRPEEDERADRPPRVLDAGAGADDGVGDQLDRLVLADHALVEDLLQAQQLVALALDQAGDRDAGPARDDLGDLLFGHLLAQQAPLALRRREALLLGAELALELGELAVAQLGGAVQVVGALGLLDLPPHLLDLSAHRPQLLDLGLLGLPLRAHRVGLGLQVGELLAQRLQPLLARLVALLLERRLFDLELHDAARHLVELLRHRVDLGADHGAGLVDEVDRLVGQEAVADVAVGEHRRRHQRVVLDAHAVVDLEALLQAAQDGDRVLDGRRLDHDRLEAALQGGVLLDVLAVLVEGGGADAVQLAARQHRLEQVAGVRRPLGLAGADDGVDLVDEEEDPPLALLDLVEHRLQALLELAAVLGAGEQRAHVEREDGAVLEPLGDVAAHDALRQPLDDGGLADAGLADQHRVVLGPAREDADDAADLVIAADDRVELAARGPWRPGPGRTSPAPRRRPRAWRSSPAGCRAPR